LRNISLDHVDQTNESDAHFITRVAADYDALTSIKDAHLLFVKNGQGKTASSKNLPNILILRSDGDSHNYSENERESYAAVKAFWQNSQTGKLETVVRNTGNGKNAT